MALPSVDLLRGDVLRRHVERDELLRPGPYVVGRRDAHGGVGAVLQRGLSWLRACRLLEGLPDDYVMRIEAQTGRNP
jgi:hypothetical protein